MGELERQLKSLVWRLSFRTRAPLYVEAIHEIVEEAKKEFEEAFENDKTNFTNYESYSMFLKWFGSK